jgi:membrane-associated phospholipid phosphatase
MISPSGERGQINMQALETEIGLAVVHWFNAAGSFFWYALLPLAAVGSEVGVMVVLATVYWSISKRNGRRLLILVLGSQVISNFAKIGFGRPRPFHVAPDTVESLSETAQFGLPSGHTIFGTVSGLWLIETLRRRWVTAAAVLYIVAMGISRMVHGMHYPQDVLSGWIVGFAFYGAFYRAERSSSRSLWNVRPAVSVSMVLAGTALLFLACLALNAQFEPRKNGLAVVGALAGAVLGLIIEAEAIGFSAGGPPGRRVLRVLVGLVVLGAVYGGTSALYYAIVGESQTTGALVLYTLRYITVGLTAAAGVPALFMRFGLAGLEESPATDAKRTDREEPS